MDRQIDKTIYGWVTEFVLMRPKTDLIKKLFPNLEIPNNNIRLEKIRILRSISDEISEGSVSETMLNSLETIEVLDRNEGSTIMASMKRAYCAVAVECTVKYLAGSRAMSWRYVDAVKRIFRTRIKGLERSGESELVCSSDELAKWSEKIEAAIWDNGVCDELLEKNTRNDALRLVREYIGDALAILGPPFLEVAVREMKKKEDRRKREETEEEVEKVKKKGLGCNYVRVETGERATGESSADPESSAAAAAAASGLVELDGEMVDNEKQNRVGGRKGGNDGDQVRSGSGTGRGDDGGGQKGAGGSPNASRRLVICDGAAAKGKEFHKENVLLKRKHIASRKRHKGSVRIVDSEELDAELSFIEYDSVSTPKYNKVREELNTSILELGALVTDPLPDALQVAKTVQDEMAKKNINHETPVINQNEKDTNASKPSDNECGEPVQNASNLSANENAEPIQAEEVNHGNQCFNLQNDAAKHSSMEWNHSILELGALVTDALPDALQVLKTLRAEMAKKNMNHETPVIHQNEKDTNACKSSDNEIGEPVQNASNLSANENAECIQSQALNHGNQCLNLQNDAAKHSSMEWNSSILELGSLVTDQLPNAFQVAITLRAEMAKKNMNHETPVIHQNEKDTNASKPSDNESGEPVQNACDPSVKDNAEPIQVEVVNHRNQCLNLQNDAANCSLMARNSTAHTYEWDDLTDVPPEGASPHVKRFHLPSPKRRAVSPLKRHETTKFVRRRTIKKWSLEEEDALRKAVQKYGKGNWKLILNCHRDVFLERTEVDLKDKWRNMTRYC